MKKNTLTIFGSSLLSVSLITTAASLRVGFANHTHNAFTYTITSNPAYDPADTQTGEILPGKKNPVSVNFTDKNDEDIITLRVAIKEFPSQRKIYSAIFSLPTGKKTQPQVYNEDNTEKYDIQEFTIRFYDQAQIGVSLSPIETKEPQIL